ncbi:MAG: alpha-1,3-mannosyltransferase family protein [Hyphomonas sp.]|nr:alpha-1,3-mannosyltransferase family protein [Hyphomonas sp.]
MVGFDTEGLGEELIHACQRSAEQPPRADGCGIVVCAGGATMLTNAYVLIRMLRDVLGCRLPIEVWHIGPVEMPALIAGILEAHGCTIVDANAVRERYPAEIHDGWQLKSYALLHSAFDDVILLDADQVPAIDPETIFAWPQYRDAGAVFWPDIIDLSDQNPVWTMVGLEPRSMRSWETGQVAVNRTRHWRSLWLTFEINQRADTFYELVYGDKDTFLIAWLMSEAKCVVVPHTPFIDERFLIQRDFAGKPALQHRSNCKWSLHDEPVRPIGALHQEECEGFLEDLRAVWNGLLFVPPSRPTGALAAERNVVVQRSFALTVMGEAPSELELLAGHQIGKGRDFYRSNWYVDAVDDGYRLVICDASKPSFTLIGREDGSWKGQFLSANGREAVLQPIPVRSLTDADDRPGLADALIDAARRGTPGDVIDDESLVGALRLVERIEPGTLDRAAVLAGRMRQTEPVVSEKLERIVGELRSAIASEGERPRDRSVNNFFNPDLYRRI